jgi:hypothetical protein
MRLSKEQVRRCAWHEAGHVTHALWVGLPFHAAWVRTDDAELPPDGMADCQERDPFMKLLKEAGITTVGSRSRRIERRASSIRRWPAGITLSRRDSLSCTRI